MEFTNTLPGSNTFTDDKSTPHVFSGTEAPPAYNAETPRCCNIRWTAARCARYDYILHVISLTLGTLTLVAYIFDLAKSASFHVGLPIGLKVVDSMSIAFLTINNTYSLVYFATGMYTRMSSGETSRKWPAILDLMLHIALVGMADTTLSMRSSSSSDSCDNNRAVGGCLPSRRALMIAAGVTLILVSVAVQLRFGITLHAAGERRKLAKAARRAAAHDQTGSA